MSSSGRKCLPFEQKSDRSQRRDALNLAKSNQYDSKLIIHAAAIAAKRTGERDLSIVLKGTTKSPARATKIKKTMQKLKEQLPLSPQDALAFLLDNKFTKQQYLAIRQCTKNRNCDIYPAYEYIRQAKLECRPFDIFVSEGLAKVPLQNLLYHTTRRILLVQEDVLRSYLQADKQDTNFTLIASYGFDGSSGFTQYKQKFLDESLTDTSMFATTLIPLRIVSSKGIIIWNNPTPQSVRFCRPIKLQYVKETKEQVLTEKRNLDKEI